MKTSFKLLMVCAFAGSCGLLPGQTVVSPSEVANTGSWLTYDIRFLTDADGNGSYDTTNSSAGLARIEVNVAGGGTVTAWDLCAEFFVGPGTDLPYTVTAGFGPLGGSQDAGIRALISNAFPLFTAAVGAGDQNQAEAYGSAIQMAAWEIIEESNSVLMIDSSDINAGIFQVDGGYVSSDIDTDAAIGHARTFLANIESGVWSDVGGIHYYHADATPNQDRLWFSTSVIPTPEPSVWLMAMLGSGLVLRRRR